MPAKKKPFANIKKGGFHKTLGKKPDAPITQSDIAKGKAMGGKAAKQAVLAENFKKMRHPKSGSAPSPNSSHSAGATKRSSPSTTSAKAATAKKHTATPKRPLTATQKEAARKADAKRYAKDKPKRIAAEKKYQAKEKAQHPEIFKARAKVNNAKRDGKITGPPGSDFHHTSYNSDKPKGHWVKRSTHRKMPNPKSPRVR